MAKQDRKIEPGKDTRAMQFPRAAYDAEKRTLSLSFASETPVMRWYGREILSHDPAHVDLSRLNDGAPLLWNHDANTVIGVVEGAEIASDRKARALVRFAKTPTAEEKAGLVADGIIRGISVGYETNSILKDDKNDKGERTVTWSWTPHEISLASVAADPRVGVGRSGSGQQEQVHMSDEPKVPPAVTVTADEQVRKMRAEAIEITALGRQHDIVALADKALADGTSLADFRAVAMEAIGNRTPPPKPQGQIGMTPKEVQRFSFMNVLRAIGGDRTVDIGFERECSAAACKGTGKATRGFLVPWDVLVGPAPARRDLAISGGTGANIVATNLMAGNFIDALQAASVVTPLGIPVLSGLSGDIAIPKGGTMTGYWVAEAGAPTESQPTMSQVTGSPNTVGAMIDISRKLMIQSAIGVEAYIRDLIARTLAYTIDVALFTGAGTNEPTGIDNAADVTDVTVTAGTPTFAEMVGFPSAIQGANAQMGALKWAMPSAVFWKLATTAIATNAPVFVADYLTGRVLGNECVVSNAVTAKYAYQGDWSQVVQGIWGNGLDLTADPYTASNTGALRIVGFMDVDFLVRHGKSFAKADILS